METALAISMQQDHNDVETLEARELEQALAISHTMHEEEKDERMKKYESYDEAYLRMLDDVESESEEEEEEKTVPPGPLTILKKDVTFVKVPGDGSCMFHSVINYLDMRGSHDWNSSTLRTQCVAWLKEHRISRNLFPSESAWEAHLAALKLKTTYADEDALVAAMDVLGLSIYAWVPLDNKTLACYNKPNDVTLETFDLFEPNAVHVYCKNEHYETIQPFSTDGVIPGGAETVGAAGEGAAFEFAEPAPNSSKTLLTPGSSSIVIEKNYDQMLEASLSESEDEIYIHQETSVRQITPLPASSRDGEVVMPDRPSVHNFRSTTRRARQERM